MNEYIVHISKTDPHINRSMQNRIMYYFKYTDWINASLSIGTDWQSHFTEKLLLFANGP